MDKLNPIKEEVVLDEEDTITTGEETTFEEVPLGTLMKVTRLMGIRGKERVEIAVLSREVMWGKTKKDIKADIQKEILSTELKSQRELISLQAFKDAV